MNCSLDSGRRPLIVLRYKAPFAALTAGIIADVLATGGLGPKRDYCEEGNSRSAAAKRSTFSAYAPLSTLLAGTSSMPPRLFSGRRFHAFQHLCAALAAWFPCVQKKATLINLSLFCAMYVHIGWTSCPSQDCRRLPHHRMRRRALFVRFSRGPAGMPASPTYPCPCLSCRR